MFADSSRRKIILIIIILAALGLRLWYTNYGLPELYLEDEPFFVNPALVVSSGHLNPGWYGAPGSTLIYVLAGLFWLLRHGWHLNYQVDPTWFHIAGRCFTAVVGALSAIIIYQIVKTYSKRAGLIAVGLVASSALLVEHSHIIRPDILQTFFILLTWFGYQKITEPSKQQTNQWRWFMLTGAAFGLAITTKYPSLFIAPTLLLAVTWQWKKFWSIKKLAVTVASTLVAMFISGPYLFLYWHQALNDLQKENGVSHGAHAGLGWLGNLWWYITQLFNWEIGSALCIVLLISLGALLFKKISLTQKPIIIFVSLSGFIYLILLSTLSLHWERWLIPVVTLLFIPTAIGIDFILERLQTKRTSLLLIIIFVTLISFGPIVRLFKLEQAYTQPYTTAAASDWVRKNISPDSKIAAEPYTTNVTTSTNNTELVSNVSIHNLQYYRANNISYLLLSDAVYGAITNAAKRNNPPTGFVAASKVYAKLLNHAQLEYAEPNQYFANQTELQQPDWQRWSVLVRPAMLGPTVYVYHLK